MNKIHSLLDIPTPLLSLLQINWSFFAALLQAQKVVAYLAVHVQVIHEFFPAGIKEVVSGIGADPVSTKMYKITLFKASRRQCQACVCFH